MTWYIDLGFLLLIFWLLIILDNHSKEIQKIKTEKTSFNDCLKENLRSCEQTIKLDIVAYKDGKFKPI